jgi:glutathione S-transferase
LRAQYVSWLFYQVGLTEPLINMKGGKMLDASPAMTRLYEAMMTHIEETLSQGPFMLGDRFTAVDVLYVHLFDRVRALLPQSAVLDAYLARGRERPALCRALAKAG